MNSNKYELDQLEAEQDELYTKLQELKNEKDLAEEDFTGYIDDEIEEANESINRVNSLIENYNNRS